MVHGDLKPANLLVTREGEVRLLDFGIARLFGNDRPAAAAGSGREQVRLTPAYASPEQWRGEAVTVASDVYQLGLLLFELLTGVRASATPPGSEAEGKRVPLASAVVRKGAGGGRARGRWPAARPRAFSVGGCAATSMRSSRGRSTPPLRRATARSTSWWRAWSALATIGPCGPRTPPAAIGS